MSYEKILAELNATPLKHIEFGKGFRRFNERMKKMMESHKNPNPPTQEKQ